LAVTTPGLNLERKCRHPRLDVARAVLAALPDARLGGTMRQTDTYFPARQGRLKLRVIHEAAAELIWYARPDEGGVRGSVYHITPVANPASLKETLAEGLGVRGEVRKTRELWLWHNVRIHLDEVDGLGTFVEFEAVIDAANDEAISLVRLEEMGRRLGLKPGDDVTGSYADLLGLA
jgi:predicted adenylyl cyclase CyaB